MKDAGSPRSRGRRWSTRPVAKVESDPTFRGCFATSEVAADPGFRKSQDDRLTASPAMTVARFRFYEELNDFLAPDRPNRDFEAPCARGATVNNLRAVLDLRGLPARLLA